MFTYTSHQGSIQQRHHAQPVVLTDRLLPQSSEARLQPGVWSNQDGTTCIALHCGELMSMVVGHIVAN